jgi:hypothetical protein
MSQSVTAPTMASKAPQKTGVVAITLEYPAFPSSEEWKTWIDSLPAGVLEWVRVRGKDINVQREFFPAFLLDPTNPQRTSASTVNEYRRKVRALTSWERSRLFSLGNPTIPEDQGGLKYEDICRHIQSSGRNVDGPGSAGYIKKGAPPMFFQTRDSGNNYGAIFRRIYWYINHHQQISPPEATGVTKDERKKKLFFCPFSLTGRSLPEDEISPPEATGVTKNERKKKLFLCPVLSPKRSLPEDAVKE